MSSKRLQVFIGIYFGALCGISHAQSVFDSVNAGSILRQTEKDLNIQTPPATLKRPVPVPARDIPPDAVTVKVNRFVFTGNTLLSDEQLQASIAPYLGRPLSFIELQVAADSVANTYRDAGWVVRAFLPKQEIEEGVVKIQIIEALFGRALIEGKQPERIAASRLIERVHAAQAPGQSLSSHNVDRVLLLLDDLPGVNVNGHLTEGENHAETDLLLSVTDESLIAGNIGLDGNGARSTGYERLTANVSLNSPARMGDALIANMLKTQGSDYARLAYSIPLGFDGARIGVHGSFMNYQLLSTFTATGANGNASDLGLDYSYPLIRSLMQNLSLSLSYDEKGYFNQDNSGTNSEYKVRSGTLSLSGNRFDDVAGGGTNAMLLALTRGSVDLAGSPNQAGDAAGAQTSGAYTKLNFTASRQQNITPDLSMNLMLSAQATDKNLDSSEKIYLGGASGVRAFPNSEAGGSTGHTVTAELRQRLSDRWMMTGFYDYGRIHVYRYNYAALATSLNAYELSGLGVSISWQSLNGIDFQASVAHRLEANPAANSHGLDSDGTKIINRIWITASKLF